MKRFLVALVLVWPRVIGADDRPAPPRQAERFILRALSQRGSGGYFYVCCKQ